MERNESKGIEEKFILVNNRKESIDVGYLF